MKLHLIIIVFIGFFSSSSANNIKIDTLLEKIQQTKNTKEKQKLLNQLKIKLSQINKQAREESNAILDAKKKIPSKPFNLQEVK